MKRKVMRYICRCCGGETMLQEVCVFCGCPCFDKEEYEMEVEKTMQCEYVERVTRCQCTNIGVPYEYLGRTHYYCDPHAKEMGYCVGCRQPFERTVFGSRHFGKAYDGFCLEL